MEEWLKDIETTYNINILFAAETGSQVWGGATEQSDHDVRFIFQHRNVKAYLSLGKVQETLDFQTPYDGQGWDIFKAFTLLNKSNPNLLEWSLSPRIYRNDQNFSHTLYRYVTESYSLYSLYQHYIHLSARNIKELGDKDFTYQSQKKLIQAVRSFLLAKTMISTGVIPSSAFYTTFEGVFPDGDGTTVIYQQLLEAKRQGKLVPMETVKECIRTMEKERIWFADQGEVLPRGKNIEDKLNQWLWDLLRI